MDYVFKIDIKFMHY